MTRHAINTHEQIIYALLDYEQNVKFRITFMTVRGHNMAVLSLRNIPLYAK